MKKKTLKVTCELQVCVISEITLCAHITQVSPNHLNLNANLNLLLLYTFHYNFKWKFSECVRVLKKKYSLHFRFINLGVVQ